MRQHTGDHLGISELTAGYGDAQVLQGVNLRVPVGSSFAVLGRNGVGKSTLLNAILGFVTVASGQIVWKGSEVHALGARETNRLGIALVPQGRRIFPSLTVEENLRVAIRRKAPSKWALDDVYALFPRLGERQKQSGGTLSGGEQQMLAIGRALMTSPDLLLLDEPTEGLAPIIIEDLVKAFLELAGSGVTILLAEQRVAFALQLCDTVAHMGSRGHIEFVGNGDEYRERYGTAA